MMTEIVAPDRKTDRRIQRTRALLRDALMTLIVRQGAWEPITIQDITDQANVSRTTFYLHFKDKEDLMITSMEDVYDDLATHYARNSITTDAVHPDASDFFHVAEFAAFYKIMLGPHGSAAFVARVHTYLAKVIRDHVLEPLIHNAGVPSTIPVDYVAHFVAGAEIGLIRLWLDTGMKESPLEMSRISDELCVRGVFNVMNMPSAAWQNFIVHP